MTKADKQQLEELTELVNRLKPFDNPLSTSIHGYIRITPENKRKLFETYYGPGWRNILKPNVMTCGSCSLNAVKNIAIEYFAAITTIEQIQAKDKNKKKDNVA